MATMAVDSSRAASVTAAIAVAAMAPLSAMAAMAWQWHGNDMAMTWQWQRLLQCSNAARAPTKQR